MTSAANAIKVMVVDDSAFMRTALRRMIESDPALRVIASAADGLQALELLARWNPDVVTLDIEMPGMNGLEALRKIMAQSPRPVIMVSSLTQEGAEMTFEALDLGAFDYIPKQSSFVSLDIVKIRDELCAKIHAAARSHRGLVQSSHMNISKPSPVPLVLPQRFSRPSVVCIGSSTGGPRALQQVLPKLPSKLPVSMMIVQHMPPGFTGPFASRLNSLCQVEVKEAEPEDILEAGRILIAPAGWQMVPYRRSLSRFAVRLSRTPDNTLHIPSVDVMMEGAAQVFASTAMGVILTGMGNDGEAGMTAIYKAGGLTVGQDEATCIVYGMPRACALAGVLHKVVPLHAVADVLIGAAKSRVVAAV